MNAKSQFWGVQLDQVNQNSFICDICLKGDVQTQPMRIENDYEMKSLIFVDSLKQIMEDFETSDIILNVQG